jgi:hypothetical protein
VCQVSVASERSREMRFAIRFVVARDLTTSSEHAKKRAVLVLRHDNETFVQKIKVSTKWSLQNESRWLILCQSSCVCLFTSKQNITLLIFKVNLQSFLIQRNSLAFVRVVIASPKTLQRQNMWTFFVSLIHTGGK